MIFFTCTHITGIVDSGTVIDDVTS